MSRPPACRLRRGKAAASLGRLSFYPIPSGCAFLMVVALSHVGATLPASEGSEPAIAGFRQDGGVFATGGLEIPADLRETPARLWRRSIDPGHSTPMIVDDLLVFTTFNEATKQLATVALDKRTGGERWRRVAPAERLEQYHRVGSPAACSVASDGRRVVAFFGSYGMVCYDRLGKEQWKRPFGPFQDEFGTGSSPIASHGRVFLNEDHDTDNFLCALDVATGRTLWQADRNQFTRSYATPLLLEVEGRWQVIVPGALTITAYDAQTGERIWWVHGLARIVNTVPVYRDGVLFVSTWAPGGDVGQRIAMESWAEAIGRYDANGDGLIRREELRDGPVLTRFFRIDINQDGGLDKQEWQKHAVVFQRARNGTMAIALPAQGDVTETHVAG